MIRGVVFLSLVFAILSAAGVVAARATERWSRIGYPESDPKFADAAQQILTGTWAGEMLDRSIRHELLIRWVMPREDRGLDMEVFYAYSGNSFFPVEDLRAGPDDGSVTLSFTTSRSSRVRIRLTGERSMAGTYAESGGETGEIRFSLKSHTPWPAAQASRGPIAPRGRSFRGEIAAFDSDVNVVSPTPDTPEDLAWYSGIWAGWCSVPTPRSVRVAVEQITAGGVDVVVADGGAGVALAPQFTARGRFSYTDGELVGRVPQHSQRWQVSLRRRPDGYMDYILLYRANRQYCAGVLTRTN